MVFETTAVARHGALVIFYWLVMILGNEEESAFALTQFHEETVVTFGDLTKQVIEGYIKTGEPM